MEMDSMYMFRESGTVRELRNMKDIHVCELRVVVQNKPFFVILDTFQWFSSSSLRLLHMCEFNYLSGDYLCGGCHFQSLLDAKHNTTRAGVALLFAGSRLAARKVSKRFQQGC